MKTPRELLLARHRPAAPGLDEIRERVVATEISSRTAPEPRRARFAGAWAELFHIPRTAWTALGAAWVVILVLNIASSETPAAKNSVAKAAPQRTPEILQALREQRQLFAELVGFGSSPDAEAPRFIPRPRSENFMARVAV